MDLTAPIIYNGLTVSGLTGTAGGSPSVGTVIERINISDMDVHAYLDKRALQDGVDAGDVYIGARTVIIDAAVYGSTKAHGWDNLQAWLRAFHPRIAFNADTANLGFLSMKFRQPTISTAVWTDAYIPLQFYLRPARPASYVVERLPSGGVAGKGLAFQVQSALVARDPRKYVQTAQSILVNSNSQTVPHRGDYPTAPILTWTMTSGGPTALWFQVAGATTTINMTGVSSGTFTFDFGKRTLVDQTGASRASLFTGQPQFNEIPPGGTTVGLFDNTGVGGGGVTLTYYEAFT